MNAKRKGYGFGPVVCHECGILFRDHASLFCYPPNEPTTPGVTRCLQCGREYRQKYGWQRYCTIRCGNQARRTSGAASEPSSF